MHKIKKIMEEKEFKLRSLISFKCHDAVAVEIRRAANKDGSTVSAWLLKIIKSELRKQGVSIVVTKELV
jgi:hypothetical protein